MKAIVVICLVLLLMNAQSSYAQIAKMSAVAIDLRGGACLAKAKEMIKILK